MIEEKVEENHKTMVALIIKDATIRMEFIRVNKTDIPLKGVKMEDSTHNKLNKEVILILHKYLKSQCIMCITHI